MATRTLLRRLRLDWPLLGKELLEQSARKQIYVIRVVYAVILFGAFCFYYMRHLSEGPVLALGRGMAPFHFLVTAQLVTIYLFLPPLMAGALAQEKERDTLGLLFLTDLTAWELILQKYFGRLIPMLTLLFLSLPLLAVTYSLGGVSVGTLFFSAAELFLTCLWVGALALECSAHEASTFQALLRCWGMCLALAMCCTFGPFPFWALARGFGGGLGGIAFLVPLAVSGVIYVPLTVLLLVRAKSNLEARAFVQRRNPFGQQFKQLDQYWKDVRKLMRAMLRKRDAEARALAQQVVQKGLQRLDDQREWSVGRFFLTRMQIPTVLSFAIIFGVICLIILAANVMLEPKSGGAFYVVVGGLWILGLLTIPIQSANAVASERINERLGAILTTPLTAREILEEWMGPVRRWCQFLFRPLIVVFAVEAIVKFFAQGAGNSRWMNGLLYLGMSLLAVWVYPALVRWLCLWIGLRIRNQIRALMTSLLVTAAWCLVPVTAAGYLVETGLLPEKAGESMRFLSPITVIRTSESIGWNSSELPPGEVLFLIAGHFVLAMLLWWLFRWLCLTRADRYLGRV